LVFVVQEAEALINQRIHPQTIIAGWRKASEAARAVLEASSIDNGYVLFKLIMFLLFSFVLTR
jgi:hypothetical protein